MKRQPRIERRGSLTLGALLALLSTVALAGCGGKTDKPSSSGGTNKPSSDGGSKDKGGTKGDTKVADLGPKGNGWGTVTGRFVIKGDKPAPKKIVPNKDVEVCGKHELFDESLLVGDDGGIANVVVYLRGPKGYKIHPDYEKQVKQEVVLDNKDCRFEPHILPIWVGKQQLIAHNSDPVGHNTKIEPPAGDPFNQLIASKDQVPVPLSKQELRPIPVQCNIHPWMGGFVVARDNPYIAVSAKDGAFTLKDLPTGTWEFSVWEEKSGWVSTGPINEKGIWVLEVKEGENKVGDIEVPASLFEKS